MHFFIKKMSKERGCPSFFIFFSVCSVIRGESFMFYCDRQGMGVTEKLHNEQ